MPIEIGEIGVHMAVGTPSETLAAEPRGDAGELSPDMIDTIVEACVAQVLWTLRKREGR